MRKIVVNGSTYRWSYKSVRYFYCRSKLTMITENREVKYIVQFITKDTYTAGSPLNEGLRMMKADKPYTINFNQPKYVAEVLQFILDLDLDTAVKKVHELDGNQMLESMGYVDLDGFLV
ncbi:hypothetical protein D3C75_943630 [compost metagenome]